MSEGGLVLTLAYLVDLVVGDPRWIPHPVVIIGRGISLLERIVRRACYDDVTLRIGGTVIVASIVGLTWGLTRALIGLVPTEGAGPPRIIGMGLIVWMASTTLATRSLIDAGRRVVTAIHRNDLSAARERVGEIVGRDTTNLSEEKVLKATIESLAENASDGIIAPLFYFALGGLPLAMAYKAVNTLDSMLGYRNERYLHLGWAAARLDDLANLVPARLTGFLFGLASLLLPSADATASFRTFIREGRKHLSPNSGYPEAAMAGALGLALGGPSVYGGRLVEKPVIGRGTALPTVGGANRAIRLTLLVSLLGFFLALGMITLLETFS